MTRKTLIAAVLLWPLTLAPALADGIVITGSNGGSIAKARDCTRDPGAAVCRTDTTYVTPMGETAARTRIRTTGQGTSETGVTFTGRDGTAATRKRVITWGN